MPGWSGTALLKGGKGSAGKAHHFMAGAYPLGIKKPRKSLGLSGL